jgi:hypothetical protein
MGSHGITSVYLLSGIEVPGNIVQLHNLAVSTSAVGTRQFKTGVTMSEISKINDKAG